MSSLSNFIGGKPYNTDVKYSVLKPSIVLFDCNPGTRSWTVPEGVSKIRAFVVGGGGGGLSGNPYAAGGGGGYSDKLIDVTPGEVFSYTVGDKGLVSSSAPSSGGTSSFGALISATGGAGGPASGSAAGGVGTGGDINTSGGDGSVGTSSGGGGGAGHAFGNGGSGVAAYGGGFSVGDLNNVLDGWKIGLLPVGDYGRGSATSTTGFVLAGPGGGGCGNNLATARGGIGGGGAAASNGNGGPGLVGIEVIA